jgi:hypothetical protein
VVAGSYGPLAEKVFRLGHMGSPRRTLKTEADENDDKPLVSLDRLRVADTTADLARRELTIGSLTLSRADTSCRREKDGSLNLVKAFVPATASEKPIEEGAVAPEKNAPSTDEPTADPVVVNLKAVKLSDVAVEVEDRVPAEPVKLRIDQIALSASDLSTATGTTGKADLSLRWEQAGQVQADGNITITPLALDMAIAVNKMDVRPFQPYLSEQAGLIVTQGFFNTEGRMAFSLKNETAPVVTYTGKAGLNRFASIDQKNANDFLKWEALLVDKLDVGVNPTRLSIDQVSLADFFARVIVDPDGSVNLVSMFNAKFNDLGGRISGLESIAEKRADVLLEGMWSNHAPVKITGRVNPLIETPYLDLNLNISDIELSPFHPVPENTSDISWKKES